MVHGSTIVQMGHGISTWVPSRVNWEELPLLHWSSSKGWLPRADRLPRGPGDHSVWSLAMKCLCRVVGMPGCSPLQLKWNKEEQWRWFGLLTAGAALHVITGCLSGDLLSFVKKNRTSYQIWYNLQLVTFCQEASTYLISIHWLQRRSQQEPAQVGWDQPHKDWSTKADPS